MTPSAMPRFFLGSPKSFEGVAGRARNAHRGAARLGSERTKTVFAFAWDHDFLLAPSKKDEEHPGKHLTFEHNPFSNSRGKRRDGRR